MNDDGVSTDNFSPSWMEDGGDIFGERQNPGQEDVQDWDTNAWSDNSQENGDSTSGPSNCIPPSPDTSKIYVQATHFVGGKWTCYWLESTECP